jgi:hypothetical protein
MVGSSQRSYRNKPIPSNNVGKTFQFTLILDLRFVRLLPLAANGPELTDLQLRNREALGTAYSTDPT